MLVFKKHICAQGLRTGKAVTNISSYILVWKNCSARCSLWSVFAGVQFNFSGLGCCHWRNNPFKTEAPSGSRKGIIFYTLTTSKVKKCETLRFPRSKSLNDAIIGRTIYSPQKDWGRKKLPWSFVFQAPAHIREKTVVGSGCSCMKQTCLKRLQQFVQAGFYVSTPF